MSALPVSRASRVPLLLVVAMAAARGSVVAQATQTVPAFRPAVDVERALPQSSVMYMMEDARGFLWFGTREGVARWDGYAMRVWRHDPFNRASLPGNVVRSLAEDREGSVWVVLHNYLDKAAGIARIVGPELEVMERFDLPARHVAVDTDGVALAITADSIFRFDARRGVFNQPFARAPRAQGRVSPDQALMATAVGRDRRLWIADQVKGGIESCDLASRTCRSMAFRDGRDHVLPDSLVAGRPFEDRDGNIWVGLRDGIGRFPRGRDQAERFDVLPPGTGAFAFTQDRAGTLWILSNDGVFELPAGATQARQHRLTTLANEANPAPVVIHADRGGTVWVGTVWGLYRHELRRSTFGHLEHNPRDANSPSAGLVTALAEDHDGQVWIGTIGGGLNRWDRRTGIITRFRYVTGDPRSLSHDIVWSLAVDSTGGLWAGTAFGLNRFDPASSAFRRYLADPLAERSGIRPSDNVVSDVVADGRGAIWTTCAPCRNSLRRLDPATGRYAGVSAFTEPAGYIELDRGALWIGSTVGIRRLDIGSQAVTSPADSGGGNLDGILAFHRGSEGSVWVGANSGLFRFDEGGHLRGRYTAANGMPGNAVFGILEDARGHLWLSTNRGLVSIDPKAASNDVRVYDHTTGIGNVEFNRNASLRARDGTMYFGGDRGVTWFHPDSVELNTYRPPVVFTTLERSTQRGTRVTHHLGDAPVRVAADEYTFTVGFAALNYINPHRNQYAVQLVDFDQDWKSLGVSRTATYTNVPPGRYEFRVRGSNDDGLWNEQPASLVVIVEPFFWQTWWFRAFLVAASVAMVIAATWYASRNRFRLALQRSESARALETERSRISRDMHDEVGASLTEIAILSEVALRTGSGTAGNAHLQRIGEKSRATIDSIGEIVWAIDPRNDAGDRFVAYLREYAADYLESAGPRAILAFPASPGPGRFTADFRRTVVLILKEALANAVRHGRPRSVKVNLLLEGGQLSLVIADDGVGFDPSAVVGRAHGEDGLDNMRQRAAAAGGELVVRSSPGQGTTVECRLPLPQAAVQVHA